MQLAGNERGRKEREKKPLEASENQFSCADVPAGGTGAGLSCSHASQSNGQPGWEVNSQALPAPGASDGAAPIT